MFVIHTYIMYVTYSTPVWMRKCGCWALFVSVVLSCGVRPTEAQERRYLSRLLRPGCAPPFGASPGLPDDPEARLHDAVLFGDLERVKVLIAEGVSLDSEYGMRSDTPLMIAAACGRLEIVEYLVREGADIDKQGGNGRSALIWATIKDHLDIVKSLLAHGADTDLHDGSGYSARDLAGVHGHDLVLDELIARGAEPGSPRSRRNRGLHVGVTPGVGYTSSLGWGVGAGFYLGYAPDASRFDLTESVGVFLQIEQYAGARRYAMGLHTVVAPYPGFIGGWDLGVNLAVVSAEDEHLRPYRLARTLMVGPEVQLVIVALRFRVGYLFLARTDAQDLPDRSGFAWSVGFGF